jgi:predicted lysophospholipase L1 biosynthesis ABC-type transport system permease subunit
VFDATDHADAPRRVVINELLAERLFGEEPALGRRIVVARDELEVIGVVGNAAIDARGEVAPVVYHAHRQFGDNRNWRLALFVQTDAPARALEIVERELAALDPALVAFRPRALDAVVSRGRARERFAAALLGGFAVLAGLLSAIGLYGTLASGVARRRREFAVRMALGAKRRHIYAQVAGRAAGLTAVGLAIGLAGAWAGAGALDALLFEVEPHDPAIFGAAAFVLAAVALVASWIPARTATRVDAAAEIK